jgi:hypothetical protein
MIQTPGDGWIDVVLICWMMIGALLVRAGVISALRSCVAGLIGLAGLSDSLSVNILSQWLRIH